jgi:hypothetical protein
LKLRGRLSKKPGDMLHLFGSEKLISDSRQAIHLILQPLDVHLAYLLRSGGEASLTACPAESPADSVQQARVPSLLVLRLHRNITSAVVPVGRGAWCGVLRGGASARCRRFWHQGAADKIE